MKPRKTTGLALMLAAIVGASTMATAVVAQPKGPKERSEERKDRREERREDRQDRREDRQEDRQDRREDRQEARQERREDRREWRDRRRTARRAFLDKWGPIHKQPVVRAELAIHARRMARLGRMRTLATEAGKEKLVQQIDKIVAKENARHEKRMETLKGGAK
jgi:Flp pilus assembly protein TadB